MKINISNLRAFAEQELGLDLPFRKIASTSFTGSGREKDPAWANRFKKDFNDLNYNVNYSLIKGKTDLLDYNPRKLGRSESTKTLKNTFYSPSSSKVSAARK